MTTAGFLVGLAATAGWLVVAAYHAARDYDARLWVARGWIAFRMRVCHVAR